MTNRFLCSLASGLLLSTATLCQSQTTVFDSVSLVPMTVPDEVLTDQCVVIQSGQIAQIRSAGQCSAPDDATRLSGGWLIPGLAEMHAHVPTPDSVMSVQDVLTLMVANGITTARGMLGAPYHLELREQIRSGEVLGPRLYTSGPSVNGNSAPDPDTAERLVREQHAAGYDFVKLHPGLSLETFERIAAVANELEMPFAGHVSNAVGVERALEAGQASIDHLDGYAQLMVDRDKLNKLPNPAFFGFNYGPWLDPETIEPLAMEAAKHQTWMVPTQTLIENVLGPASAVQLGQRAEMRFASDGQINEWAASKSGMIQNPLYRPDHAQGFIEMRRRLIKAMNDAGVPLLLGSDAPQIFNVPGFSLHRELEILVESGLTPWQALATGTVNVARFFEATDEFGTIQPGLAADLIWLEDNPLEDITAAAKPAGVMLRGHWLPREKLDELLEAIAEKARS